MGIVPGDGARDPRRRLSIGHTSIRVVPIALLVILGFFPKWQLALIIILVFLFSIGWSVKMKHRRSDS
jgi:hypothetical protein